MRRRFFVMILVLLSLAALPAGVGAQARTRCFAETGHCVSGPILDYWEHNGGLAVFGYPISDEYPNEIVEGSWVGRTQWFERDRLEDHSAEGQGLGNIHGNGRNRLGGEQRPLGEAKTGKKGDGQRPG